MSERVSTSLRANLRVLRVLRERGERILRGFLQQNSLKHDTLGTGLARTEFTTSTRGGKNFCLARAAGGAAAAAAAASHSQAAAAAARTRATRRKEIRGLEGRVVEIPLWWRHAVLPCLRFFFSFFRSTACQRQTADGAALARAHPDRARRCGRVGKS